MFHDPFDPYQNFYPAVGTGLRDYPKYPWVVKMFQQGECGQSRTPVPTKWGYRTRLLIKTVKEIGPMYEYKKSRDAVDSILKY